MASTVSSLKDCERWRGEIVRDISRKVSKIQDGQSLTFSLALGSILWLNQSLSSNYTVGLTDYEIRDLNDEINKLMREKGHWERQIVTLGGANYRRARTAMVDDEGREVPGTRGYK
jgi:pre-mRNA-splicing factor ISY1